MKTLANFCREIYYGASKRAIRARYGFLLFDLLVISYFVVTTFIPSYDWIVFADMGIGVVDFETKPSHWIDQIVNLFERIP